MTQAAPNTFNTALPVAQGQTIWREQLVLRERSDDGPMDRDVSVQALVSVLGYGVTSKLAVFGMVPYFFNKELDVAMPMGPMDRIERDTSGFGDLSLFGRYTLYKKDFTGSTFRVAPGFGLTAPTGDDNDIDRFGELPRPLQAGDGAWDGFARGDETRFDASLQYRIWPRSMQGVSGTPGFVYALLESSLVYPLPSALKAMSLWLTSITTVSRSSRRKGTISPHSAARRITLAIPEWPSPLGVMERCGA
jgi:hypothetical protein